MVRYFSILFFFFHFKLIRTKHMTPERWYSRANCVVLLFFSFSFLSCSIQYWSVVVLSVCAAYKFMVWRIWRLRCGTHRTTAANNSNDRNQKHDSVIHENYKFPESFLVNENSSIGDDRRKYGKIKAIIHRLRTRWSATVWPTRNIKYATSVVRWWWWWVVNDNSNFE